MEVWGFEPQTFRMRSEHSTPELYPQRFCEARVLRECLPPPGPNGRKYDMLDNWPATSSRIVYSLVRPVCQNRPALYPRGIATHTINQIKVCR